jgi:TctA family transporter
LGEILIHVPPSIQNLTPHVSLNPKKNDPKLLNIDGWSIGHIMVYISIGLFFPGKYLAVLVISILCEAYEYAVGWRARWLLDPVVNMVGYILGSLIEKYYKHDFYKRMKNVLMFHHIGCSFSLVTLLLLILFVNQPQFMKHDFY